MTTIDQLQAEYRKQRAHKKSTVAVRERLIEAVRRDLVYAVKMNKIRHKDTRQLELTQ